MKEQVHPDLNQDAQRLHVAKVCGHVDRGTLVVVHLLQVGSSLAPVISDLGNNPTG